MTDAGVAFRWQGASFGAWTVVAPGPVRRMPCGARVSQWWVECAGCGRVMLRKAQDVRDSRWGCWECGPKNTRRDSGEWR